MKTKSIKYISAILIVVFIVQTNCYGLAPLLASQNPIVKREIEFALQRTRVIVADPEDADAMRLLRMNKTECLLLSSGNYLVSQEVYKDKIRLLRAITHEDIEALMQILSEEDRYTYLSIRDIILREFPPDSGREIPIDLYVNHVVARAFEWITLLSKGILVEKDIPASEIRFLKKISPIIVSRKTRCFQTPFWDSRVRGEMIREAVRKGMVFYQVADADDVIPDCIQTNPAEAANDPYIDNRHEAVKNVPILQRELHLPNEVYYGDFSDVIILAGMLKEEIEEDPNRHICAILEQVSENLEDEEGPEAARLNSEIYALLDRIDDARDKGPYLDESEKDNEELLFPFANIAYRALVEVVRSWPKRDLHTHISNSISEESILQGLIRKQKEGDTAFIVRVKAWLEQDKDTSEAKDKMYKLLFDESGDAKDFSKIKVEEMLAVFDDIHLRGVRDLRDICIENMPPDEAEEYFLDIFENVIRENFTDGVREVELRFNPFKKFLFMRKDGKGYEPIENWEYIIDTFLRKLDNRLRVIEKKADEKYGVASGKHRVLFVFSIGRDKLENEKFEKDKWHKRFNILENIKGRFGFSAYYGERLTGIDIAGIEPFDDFKGLDEQALAKGIKEKYHLEEMAGILDRLGIAGYMITTHLGCRYGAKPRDDVKGHAAFVKAHLDAWGGVLDRVGHGKIFTTENVRIEQDGGRTVVWDEYDRGKARDLVKFLKERNIAIESCPQKHESYSIYRLIYDLPNTFWIQNNVPVVYGTDGFYLSDGITLSQWIVRLMLTFPYDGRNLKFDVESIREAVSSHKKELYVNANIVEYCIKAWNYFSRRTKNKNTRMSALLISPNEFLRKVIELSRGRLDTRDPLMQRIIFREVEDFRLDRVNYLAKEQLAIARKLLEYTRERARSYLAKERDDIKRVDILTDYEKVINQLFIVHTAFQNPDDLMKEFQDVYVEMEEFRVKSDHEEEDAPFLIVISATARADSLESLIGSVLKDLETFNYGLVMDMDKKGNVIKRWDKVKIVVIENSPDQAIFKANTDIINKYRAKGLNIIYYGMDEKVRVAKQMLKREGESGLRYRLGISSEDLRTEPYLAVSKRITEVGGYSASRNFSFDITKECLDHMPEDTITLFMDDDEMIDNLIIHPEDGIKYDRPFSFFHTASRYFKDPTVDIMAGNVTGDPPIGGANMMLGNLIDLRETLERLAQLDPNDEYSNSLFEGALEEFIENIETELFNDFRSRRNWSGKTPVRDGGAFLRVPRRGEVRTVGGQFKHYASETETILFGKQVTRPIAYFPNSNELDENMAVVPKLIWAFFGTGGNLMIRKKILREADVTCIPTMRLRREDVILERLMEAFIRPVLMTFIPVRHGRLMSGYRMGLTKTAGGNITFIRFLDNAYYGYIFQRLVEKVFELEYISSMEDFIRVASEIVSGKRPEITDWYVSIKQKRLERQKEFYAKLRTHAREIREKGFLDNESFWWNKDPEYKELMKSIKTVILSIEIDLDPENEDYVETFTALEERAADRTLQPERDIIESIADSYPLIRNYLGEHSFSYVDLGQTERELAMRASRAEVPITKITIVSDNGESEEINVPIGLKGAKKQISVYIMSVVFNFLLRVGAKEKVYISCEDEKEARGLIERIKKVSGICKIDFTVRENFDLDFVPISDAKLNETRQALYEQKAREADAVLPQQGKSGTQGDLYMSLDLGKTSTKIVVQEKGQIIHEEKIDEAFYRKKKRPDISKRVNELIVETLQKLHKTSNDICGICILVPDIVDKSDNASKKLSSSDVDYPAIIRHDSEGYAAEIKRATGINNVYLLTLGTHPGTQAIIDGEIQDEPIEMSMSVVCIDKNNDPVQLRDLISTEAVVSEAFHKGIITDPDMNRPEALKYIAQKVQEQDEPAIDLMQYMGEYLALHIIDMKKHLLFDKVVITGGMCQSGLGEHILQNTQESLNRRGMRNINVLLLKDEVDLQFGGAKGGIYLAEEHWASTDESSAVNERYRMMIEDLAEERSFSRWRRVFDEFERLQKDRPDDFGKVTLYFEEEKGIFSELSLHIPKGLPKNLQEIITRYIATCIDNNIVGSGDRKVVVKTDIKRMFTEIKEAFQLYFGNPDASVKIADTVAAYSKVSAFKIVPFTSRMNITIKEKHDDSQKEPVGPVALARPIKSIGVSIGKQKIKIGIIEISGEGCFEFVGRVKDVLTWETTDDRSSYETLFQKLVKGIEGVLSDNDLTLDDIEGIGVAAATAVEDGKPLKAQMGFARAFTEESLQKLHNIRTELSKAFGDITVEVEHDGDTESIGIARSKALKNILVLKCGQTPGIGIVGNDGEMVKGLTEFGKVVTDMGASALRHDKTLVHGEVASYLGWSGIEKVAKRNGLYKKHGFDEKRPVPGILQEWLSGTVETTQEQRNDAREVFMEGGRQLGELICILEEKYALEYAAVSGGLYFGETGRVFKAAAEQVLAEHSSKVKLIMDISDKRKMKYGGIIGGGYLVYDSITRRSHEYEARNIDEAVRMYRNVPHIIQLTPYMNEYDWGGNTEDDGSPAPLRQLVGAPASEKPAAELAYGAHPKMPCDISLFGIATSLDKIISLISNEVLGPAIVKRFGRRMPILFKFLDAYRPLSIQCHPYKKLAEELHGEFPDDYDSSNKPEAFVAIDDKGFTSLGNIYGSFLILTRLNLLKEHSGQYLKAVIRILLMRLCRRY